MQLGDSQPDNHLFSMGPAAELHPKTKNTPTQMGLTAMTPAVSLPTITRPFSVKKRSCEIGFLFLTRHQSPFLIQIFESFCAGRKKRYLKLILWMCGGFEHKSQIQVKFRKQLRFCH